MRKILMIAVAALAALTVVPSNAQPLAACSGAAGFTGVPFNPSAGGVCSAPIALTQTTDVLVRLVPGETFTGVLTAKVTAPGYGGQAVRGVFVAGELVNGMSEDALTVVAAQDAAWTLTVTAGEPVTTSTYLFPPLPQQVTAVGAALGTFGAEVVAAPAQS